MPRREYYRVPAINGDNTFAPGVQRSFKLDGIAREGLLSGIDIIVKGSLDLGAAQAQGAQYPGGGVYNLLSAIELSITDINITPAVQRRLQNETLINLPGWAFGYRGSADQDAGAGGLPPAPGAVGANSKNRMPRINLMQPGRLLMPTIDFIEPDPNNAAAQEIFAIYRIPFTFAQGQRPSDLWMDMDFIRALQIRVQCGLLNDIVYKSDDGAAMPATFNGTIEILPVNLQSLDDRGNDGTGHLSNGVLIASFDTIPVVATQSADKRFYNTSHNVLYDHLVFQARRAANIPYDGTDGILKNLRMQRSTTEKLKLPAQQLRSLNARQFFAPGAAMIDRANDITHILANSGLVTLNGFADDYDIPFELAHTVFQGNADNSAFIEMDYTKPAQEARILRILVEYMPSMFIAAMSRKDSDLNPQEREIANAADKEDNQRAQVQRTARNMPTPTR